MKGHNILHQDGSSEGSLHRLLLRNMKNHLLFYVSPHLFWSSASYSQSDLSLQQLNVLFNSLDNGSFVCKFSRNVYSKLYHIEN